MTRLIRKATVCTLLLPLLAIGSPIWASSSHNKSSNTRPLVFAKGSISTTVSGTLLPKQDEHWYTFDAQSGQYTIINIRGMAGIEEIANVGVLISPTGEQDGTKGGIVYQGCLTQTGTYKLRIARNLMATHGGKAGYQAEVIVLPPYASQKLCKKS